MTRKKVIIIGGGVAGLSMGTYLQRNGYDTNVLEMTTRSGGVCIAWKRKGYTFDGATNWLPGSAPSLNLHGILAEVLDFNELDIVDFDEFVRIEALGESLTVFNDVDRFRDEMLRLAPRDERPIRKFTNAVAGVKRLVIPVDKTPELWGPLDVLRAAPTALPVAAFAARWRNVTIAQYARRFTDPRLRFMFQLIFPRHEHFSVLGLMMSLGWMNMGSAGYPLGGSLRFADAVEARYLEAGGELTCRATVERILVEKDSAKGVVLADGEVLRADHVVSTADLRHTVVELLGGAYPPRQGADLQSTEPPVFPGVVQVSLGVGRTFDGVVHKSVIPFEPPMAMGADGMIPNMVVRVCHFDPSFAPPGKTSIIVHVRTYDSDWWEDLRAHDRERYRAEKERVARQVIETLDQRFGGVEEHLEVTDVATPATYARYTNNWKGSYQGWAPVPGLIGRSRPKTFPGLSNCYLAGQWLEAGGGLPRVVLSARNTAQLICHHDGRVFEAPDRRTIG